MNWWEADIRDVRPAKRQEATRSARKGAFQSDVGGEAMGITVEARVRDGDWKFTAGYSSVDAAKTACRQMRKDDGRVSYREIDFRIYDNDRLFFVNAVGSGWRLRWVPGNGKSRKEQS
jgi:hypothetical protein